MTNARTLSLENVDRADELASQITNILYCIQTASQAEIIPNDAIQNAIWAANTLLAQLIAIVTGNRMVKPEIDLQSWAALGGNTKPSRTDRSQKRSGKRGGK
jgi:hypothetical protein